MRPFAAGLVVTLLGTTVLPARVPAMAQDVPDALSVEWQGEKLCEKLSEDTQIRILRCSFPPGTMHLCHSHPSYVSYVLNGGQARVQDQNGTWEGEVRAGSYVDVPPVRWHEVINTGDTTLQFLLIERKYQTAPPASENVCPGRRPAQ
jgi:quercetin dioxygenase-like cupin family protein